MGQTTAGVIVKVGKRVYFIACLLFIGLCTKAYAFVLLGPVDPAEQTLSFGGTPVTSANISDELGGPINLGSLL